MCRTLRGGRADAMTTFTPVAGKARSETAALAQTFFDLSSNVPSRSIATSLMIGRSVWSAANASRALVSGMTEARSEDGSGSPLLLAVIRKVIGDDRRLRLS